MDHACAPVAAHAGHAEGRHALNYGELFRALSPEAVLVAGALLVLGVDLALGRKKIAEARWNAAARTGILSIGLAACFTYAVGASGTAFDGALVLDSLTRATRFAVLILAGLSLALLPGTVRLRHPAEFVAIVLFATAGFTVMAAAQNLLVAFLALELASLSLYVLAGFDKSRPESAEAALKYFLFGGVSAAFLLFGFSLIYGLTGSIEIPAIARQIGHSPGSPLLVVALVMVLAAFGFKAAAAPFHLWAPDVYQGAPAPAAALIASASKVAGFTLFARLLWSGVGDATGQAPLWMLAVAILAGASLMLGNLVALAQRNLRRLLAYSAIAHAGVMLLGVITGGRFGPAALIYYTFTYGLATIGAFGVIAVVERAGRCDTLEDLAGLHRRSPLLAGCLAVFVLSLAGIPPLAGFFGKFLLFSQALRFGGLSGPAGGLAFLAIALSAVALYYYLLVLKQAYVAAPAAGCQDSIRVPAKPALALLLAAALLIALGVFPGSALGLAT
ncbi:MAG: NADH-quinone oxidoreductase subunit N [Opitutaceae bacterium]|nr:NADH-quinone oxidoreductase subunit N [Opitutaceae bacterium]